MMYECFHCGERAVLWMNDFTFEDCEMEGDGIVHMLLCTECGAMIECRVPCDDGEGE